jgi:hypothetical protein
MLLLLVLTVAAALGVSPAGVGQSQTVGVQASASPPNIVFIMVDDMRNDDLRFMPNTAT